MRGIKALRWTACGLLFIAGIFYGLIAFRAMCFEGMYVDTNYSLQPVPRYRWLSIGGMALPLVLLAVGIACTLIGTYKRGLKWQITSWAALLLTASAYLAVPPPMYTAALYLYYKTVSQRFSFLNFSLPVHPLFRLLFLAGIMLILISVIWAGIKRSRQASVPPPMVL